MKEVLTFADEVNIDNQEPKKEKKKKRNRNLPIDSDVNSKELFYLINENEHQSKKILIEVFRLPETGAEKKIGRVYPDVDNFNDDEMEKLLLAKFGHMAYRCKHYVVIDKVRKFIIREFILVSKKEDGEKNINYFPESTSVDHITILKIQQEHATAMGRMQHDHMMELKKITLSMQKMGGDILKIEGDNKLKEMEAKKLEAETNIMIKESELELKIAAQDLEQGSIGDKVLEYLKDDDTKEMLKELMGMVGLAFQKKQNTPSKEVKNVLTQNEIDVLLTKDKSKKSKKSKVIVVIPDAVKKKVNK